MDRGDADNEGTTLPPAHHRRTIERHDDEYIRLLARDEANKAIITHLRLCPMAEQKLPDRLHSLEMSFWKLVGFMAGSGLLGGAVGAGLMKAIL